MEKKKENVRKGLIIGCMVSAAILLGFLGSYAYFISAGNNNSNQEADVQTGSMVLVFEDGNNGINQALNFGESVTKTFTIENTGTLDATAKMSFDKLINTYTIGSLSYTLEYSETETGEYKNVVNDRNIFTSEKSSIQVLANNLKVPAGEKYYYKLTITLNYLENVDQTSDLNAYFSTNFKIENGSQNIVEKIKMSAHPASNTPNFALIATTDEGVYQMEDDYGMSYYYRGAVENNYVKFADLYWRIIRVNGDGTLRLIYDGTSAHRNGEASEDRVAIQNVKWNEQPTLDAKYVGYMFGGQVGEASTSYEQATTNETDSNAKLELDKWYKENILSTQKSQFISDTLFCNDRSFAFDNKGTGYGYPQNQIVFYASRGRLYSNNPQTPDIKCPRQQDTFTVSDQSKGNGALTYPVGLITAEEVALAGNIGYYNSNTSFYLYKGIGYWSMTPSGCDRISGSSISDISKNGENVGKDPNWYVTKLNSIAPVINLSREYIETMNGDGTIDSPYIGIG